MDSNMKLIDIPSDIPLDGYLWFSNEREPHIFVNKPLAGEAFPPKGVNPFIVEGNLFDPANSKSYSLRYDGSETRIYCYDHNQLPYDYTPLEYIPVRMGDVVRRLVFRQYWEKEADPLCEDLEVLKPSSIVFFGFKK